MHKAIEELREQGYAVIRNFVPPAEMQAIGREVDRLYALGLTHHATYRDGNLLFEILNDPQAQRRVVLQAHWTARISQLLEQLRRDARFHDLLVPALGPDIRQMTQQLHWKPPGAKYTFYRFHQDARFRPTDAGRRPDLYGTITTGLAIDPQTVENGALQVIPKSHLHGYLGLSDDGPIMVGQTQESELRKAGLDPAQVVTCEMQPGDLLLWTLYTVHGSGPNRADYDRRLLIQSYVSAAEGDRGEWVFRDGVSTPLGPVPEICKYEQLRERPGPFYIEDDGTEEGKAARG